jgi:two-component system sensor histidine kinase KdpD
VFEGDNDVILVQTGTVHQDHSYRMDTAAREKVSNGGYGELRIFLGAAPGVGKTFSMLSEAQRRLERGADLVAGVIETHGRDKTAELTKGIEAIPLHTIHYRGADFLEFDVDAVLERKPEVVLIDELAHTNIPGSRNEKRWQDILEILAAGIDVLSTVNIQHLASLNDVVERITGIHQNETVPDEFVRQADQIELVDITPESLRRRLAHGNVYPARRVDAALSNYFRIGNLTALRELALLWVADQVDVALQRYREKEQITELWETRERVVVAITGGKESVTLMRRARRIASRSGADLLVLHIMRDDGLSSTPSSLMTDYRNLAEELGATYHTVIGDNVPEALLEFARGANATQLVLGTSRRSRTARVFDEGIGAAVIHDSGPIDVHMVTHTEESRGFRAKLARSPLSLTRKMWGWISAFAFPGIVTLGGISLDAELNMSTNVAGYVLATVLVALVGGMASAVTSALVGGVLLNYFFVPPIHTLTIASFENLITLVTMMVVAVLVALVVDRAARQAQRASRARLEASLLASYARTVLINETPLDRLLVKIKENFGLTAVGLVDDGGEVFGDTGGIADMSEAERELVDVDVEIEEGLHLMCFGRTLRASDRTILEAAAGQALLALRQQRMAKETAAAQRKAEANELRTALLSAVGHDLRTPLTSIKAAMSTLRDANLVLSAEDNAELLATVDESADRLHSLVDNLLDSSRLATGAVQPLLSPVGYEEAVMRALRTIDNSALVEVEIGEDLPDVIADGGLLERVIANLLDNAIRHGITDPERQRVSVFASAYGGFVELRIVDHGPGLSEEAQESMFGPFQRLGDRDRTTGVGLGLWVVKGFAEAMGGAIAVETTPGGGLTMVLSLPVADVKVDM